MEAFRERGASKKSGRKTEAARSPVPTSSHKKTDRKMSTGAALKGQSSAICTHSGDRDKITSKKNSSSREKNRKDGKTDHAASTKKEKPTGRSSAVDREEKVRKSGAKNSTSRSRQSEHKQRSSNKKVSAGRGESVSHKHFDEDKPKGQDTGHFKKKSRGMDVEEPKRASSNRSSSSKSQKHGASKTGGRTSKEQQRDRTSESRKRRQRTSEGDQSDPDFDPQSDSSKVSSEKKRNKTREKHMKKGGRRSSSSNTGKDSHSKRHSGKRESGGKFKHGHRKSKDSSKSRSSSSSRSSSKKRKSNRRSSSSHSRKTKSISSDEKTLSNSPKRSGSRKKNGIASEHPTKREGSLHKKAERRSDERSGSRSKKSHDAQHDSDRKKHKTSTEKKRKSAEKSSREKSPGDSRDSHRRKSSEKRAEKCGAGRNKKKSSPNTHKYYEIEPLNPTKEGRVDEEANTSQSRVTLDMSKPIVPSVRKSVAAQESSHITLEMKSPIIPARRSAEKQKEDAHFNSYDQPNHDRRSPEKMSGQKATTNFVTFDTVRTEPVGMTKDKIDSQEIMFKPRSSSKIQGSSTFPGMALPFGVASDSGKVSKSKLLVEILDERNDGLASASKISSVSHRARAGDSPMTIEGFSSRKRDDLVTVSEGKMLPREKMPVSDRIVDEERSFQRVNFPTHDELPVYSYYIRSNEPQASPSQTKNVIVPMLYSRREAKFQKLYIEEALDQVANLIRSGNPFDYVPDSNIETSSPFDSKTVKVRALLQDRYLSQKSQMSNQLDQLSNRARIANEDYNPSQISDSIREIVTTNFKNHGNFAIVTLTESAQRVHGVKHALSPLRRFEGEDVIKAREDTKSAQKIFNGNLGYLPLNQELIKHIQSNSKNS